MAFVGPPVSFSSLALKYVSKCSPASCWIRKILYPAAVKESNPVLQNAPAITRRRTQGGTVSRLALYRAGFPALSQNQHPRNSDRGSSHRSRRQAAGLVPVRLRRCHQPGSPGPHASLPRKPHRLPNRVGCWAASGAGIPRGKSCGVQLTGHRGDLHGQGQTRQGFRGRA